MRELTNQEKLVEGLRAKIKDQRTVILAPGVQSENLREKEKHREAVKSNQQNNLFVERRVSRYYKEELAKAHALLGRILHQHSEKMASVNLNENFPTDNSCFPFELRAKFEKGLKGPREEDGPISSEEKSPA